MVMERTSLTTWTFGRTTGFTGDRIWQQDEQANDFHIIYSPSYVKVKESNNDLEHN